MNDRDMARTAPTGRAGRASTAVFAVCLALIALGGPSRQPASSCAIAETTGGSAESSPTSTQPLPLKMKTVGDAQQVLIATGNKIGATSGTLQFFDYENGSWVCTLSVPARFGKRGLMDGARRWAGNKTTPTGLWKMPGFVFGNHAHAPRGTKEGYRHITKRSWWSSKRGRTYNKWVEAKRWPGEHLYGVSPQYEYAISIGYNALPNRRVYGRGSGIFLHINGKGLTAGCVSISRANMLRVVALLDPAKRPAFAVGTLKAGTATSIWAY